MVTLCQALDYAECPLGQRDCREVCLIDPHEHEEEACSHS